MSRVGNAPVSIPDGVTLTIDADVIKVKGSNGELQKKIPASVGVSIDEKLVSSLWIGYTLFAVAGGVWIFLNIIINSGRLLGFLLGKNEPNKLWSKDIGNWPVWMIPLILLLSYYGHSYLSVITTGDFNAITSPSNYLYFYFDTMLDVMASNPDV